MQMEQERKAELKKQREAKGTVIRSNLSTKTTRKNREMYDIQKLRKEQLSNYKPFDQIRYKEIVRKAHQRQ